MVGDIYWKIKGLILLVWLAMIGLAWLLAKVYMPAFKSLSGGGFLADVAMWLGALFITLIFLILLRKAFYKVFWRELNLRSDVQSQRERQP